jgi:hypothetical protein
MTLPIISADQRLAEHHGIKGCIFGKSGIGKTSLLKTLDPGTTLFMDLEAGDLAVQDWRGNSIRPKSWKDCRDFGVFIGGANSSLPDDQPYSQAHFEDVCSRYGDPRDLDKYETIFIDSITVAGRLSFQWAKTQSLVVDKKDKDKVTLDTRAAYGLHGQELLAWLIHLQHTRHKNIWFVGILDEKRDDFNRRYYEPQIDGMKVGLELPGIVDQVITMTAVEQTEKDKNGKDVKILRRTFVCQTLNDEGYPAKDRSGRLEMEEEADLGKLMAKIQGTSATPLSASGDAQ